MLGHIYNFVFHETLAKIRSGDQRQVKRTVVRTFSRGNTCHLDFDLITHSDLCNAVSLFLGDVRGRCPLDTNGRFLSIMLRPGHFQQALKCIKAINDLSNTCFVFVKIGIVL